MANTGQPTEPGWYWLKGREGWEVAQVLRAVSPADKLVVSRVGFEDYDDLESYFPYDWGGRITQAPEPYNPPF